jgi:hypothetical protein
MQNIAVRRIPIAVSRIACEYNLSQENARHAVVRKQFGDQPPSLPGIRWLRSGVVRTLQLTFTVLPEAIQSF